MVIFNIFRIDFSFLFGLNIGIFAKQGFKIIIILKGTLMCTYRGGGGCSNIETITVIKRFSV